MPAPDLTPQVPGDQPAASITPPDEAHPDEVLASLAEGNAEQVIGALPGLADEDLEALAVLESETRNRVTVLRAISAELSARGETEPDPMPQADAELPAQFDRAILTPHGWVVPEPHQRTTPPKA